MRKIFIIGCIACVILLLSSFHAKATKRNALVIGNGAYNNAPLNNPVNDAGDMANVLMSNGFEVILKINSTKRDMKSAVWEFGKKLRKDGGVGLFYYAGHGI